ncbi:unnamed protein product [Vitrella brassicaformis CCMP3155]|uniref:Peptidase M3A/M3B catalytic domain-containing protein n=3 Tax=Vitrella brassicaformis TaxID=1169539 RepID=A0A0G4EQ25_VITBC|nr:unnamed protein product [Vitrella brassicaformis CCMP3155]|eukprot:CEL99502.1 unnamed protein product [Vitrella brassicaformis CCMP3155]
MASPDLIIAYTCLYLNLFRRRVTGWTYRRQQWLIGQWNATSGWLRRDNAVQRFVDEQVKGILPSGPLSLMAFSRWACNAARRDLMRRFTRLVDTHSAAVAMKAKGELTEDKATGEERHVARLVSRYLQSPSTLPGLQSACNRAAVLWSALESLDIMTSSSMRRRFYSRAAGWCECLVHDSVEAIHTDHSKDSEQSRNQEKDRRAEVMRAISRCPSVTANEALFLSVGNKGTAALLSVHNEAAAMLAAQERKACGNAAVDIPAAHYVADDAWKASYVSVRNPDVLRAPVARQEIEFHLAHVSDSETRAKLLTAMLEMVDPKEEAAATLAVLRSRRAMAKELGFSCWRDYSLAKLTVETPESIGALHQELWRAAQPHVKAVEERARRELGAGGGKGKGKGDKGQRMELHDWIHFAAKDSHLDTTHELAQYFAHDTYFDRLRAIFESVYQVDIERVPAARHNYGWPQQVAIYAVKDRDRRGGSDDDPHLGYVYVDIMADERSGGAGCHVVGLGHVRLMVETPVEPGPMSMPVPFHAVSDKVAHEFGHCLHFLFLMKAMQQRLRQGQQPAVMPHTPLNGRPFDALGADEGDVAGILSVLRAPQVVPLDLIETAAVMQEHLVREPRVLDELAQHLETGARMTEDLVRRVPYSVHERLSILQYSIVDHYIHGPDMDPDKCSEDEFIRRVRSVFQQCCPARLPDKWHIGTHNFFQIIGLHDHYAGALSVYLCAHIRSRHLMTHYRKAAQKGRPVRFAQDVKQQFWSNPVWSEEVFKYMPRTGQHWSACARPPERGAMIGCVVPGVTGAVREEMRGLLGRKGADTDSKGGSILTVPQGFLLSLTSLVVVGNIMLLRLFLQRFLLESDPHPDNEASSSTPPNATGSMAGTAGDNVNTHPAAIDGADGWVTFQPAGNYVGPSRSRESDRAHCLFHFSPRLSDFVLLVDSQLLRPLLDKHSSVHPLLGDQLLQQSIHCSFHQREALSGVPGYVSFESVLYPGFFLYGPVRGNLVRLGFYDKAAVRRQFPRDFRVQASFRVVEAISGSKECVSVESQFYPTWYLRHHMNELMLGSLDKTANVRKLRDDACWLLRRGASHALVAKGGWERPGMRVEDFRMKAVSPVVLQRDTPPPIRAVYSVFSLQNDTKFGQVFQQFVRTSFVSSIMPKGSNVSRPVHAKLIDNSGAATYRSPGWYNAIHQQAQYWVDVVRDNMMAGEEESESDVAVVCSDIDLQFFPGWAKAVSACLSSNDICFQAGGGGPINTGFFAMRCNSRSLHFWQHVRDLMLALPHGRFRSTVLWVLLSDPSVNISWATMPPDVVASGPDALQKPLKRIKVHHAIMSSDSFGKLTTLTVLREKW